MSTAQIIQLTFLWLGYLLTLLGIVFYATGIPELILAATVGTICAMGTTFIRMNQ